MLRAGQVFQLIEDRLDDASTVFPGRIPLHFPAGGFFEGRSINQRLIRPARILTVVLLTIGTGFVLTVVLFTEVDPLLEFTHIFPSPGHCAKTWRVIVHTTTALCRTLEVS